MQKKISMSESQKVDLANEIRQQQQANKRAEGLQIAVSSILMFAGALTGGFLGVLGTAIGSGLIIMGGMVDEIANVKDLFKTIISSKQQGTATNLDSRVASLARHAATQSLIWALESQKEKISTLDDSQKFVPKEFIPHTIPVIRSDTNKLIDWISRHKKGIITAAAYGVASIVSLIFPAVGSFLFAAPITIGMAIRLQPSRAQIFLLQLYNIRFGTQLQSLDLITDTERRLFGESVGLSKRAILSYIKGERTQLELETLSKIYSGVYQWGENVIALGAIRRFSREIGIKFQLIYDINTILYEYTNRVFRPREIASILEVSYERFRSTFLRKDRQAAPMDREKVMEYLYKIHRINLGNINRFLPARRHIRLSDLNNIKRQSISKFTDYVFEGEILPEEMKNNFEMLRNIVFAISDSRGRLVSLKELSVMIDRNQKYLVDSLRKRPDMHFDDLKSLYDVLTKRELAQMLAPKIYNILQEDYFKYVDYAIRYDRKFAEFYDNALNLITQGIGVENTYPKLFTDNIKVIALQREILYKFQGGRDLLTGERIPFKDLAKTHRHHWRTSDPYNKLDCRIRALVLLTDSNHATVTHSADQRHYENLFIQAIESLLEGEPPGHWSDQAKAEFEAENRNGLNYKGIKYLFLY